MFLKLSLPVKWLVLALGIGLSLALAYFFYERTLSSTSALSQAGFSFCLTWSFILGAFLLFQTFKYVRFPAAYYRKLRFETPTYFRLLGLDVFRYVLVHSFFKRLNQRVYLRNKEPEEIQRFIEETKQSETSHQLSFWPTLGLQWALFEQHLFAASAFLCAWNLLFNLYPILLQRKNRFSFEDRFGLN
ncbi:MAG: hypothetical protein RLZZ301_726 [Bacteroidota bacterium]|jgi:hypothetical protein